MRDKLIVSEVAKLLNISTHTIRYYDKEGLLTSEYDEESGYRLFDMEDVVRLSNVILLRDSGIPIKEIKELIRNYSSELYKSKLSGALRHLEAEKEKIRRQECLIGNILSVFEDSNEKFETVKRPFRKYKFIKDVGYDEQVTPKDYLALMDSFKGKNLNYHDMTYELKEDFMTFMMEDESHGDIVIDSGEYLEYTFVINRDKDYLKAIGEFYQYATENKINLASKLYLTLKPHGMLVVDYGHSALLFSKIT